MKWIDTEIESRMESRIVGSRTESSVNSAVPERDTGNFYSHYPDDGSPTHHSQPSDAIAVDPNHILVIQA